MTSNVNFDAESILHLSFFCFFVVVVISLCDVIMSIIHLEQQNYKSGPVSKFAFEVIS